MVKDMHFIAFDGIEYDFDIEEVLQEFDNFSAQLVLAKYTCFNCSDILPLIIYESGIIMSPKDWQGVVGDTADEILEFNDWIDIRTGKHAVVLFGLPHVIE